MNLVAPIPLTGTAAAPRAASTPEDRARIEQVARDLEGQFAQMMVKSMRDAGFGDSMLGGQNTAFRDMHDRQVAQQLTAGRGLGLQSMIVRQLAGPEAAPAGEGVPASSGSYRDPRLEAGRMFSLAGYSRPVAARPLELAPSNAAPRANWIAPAAAPAPAAPAIAAAPSIAPAAPTTPAARLEGLRAEARAGSPEAFVAEILPHAERAAEALGVDPRALIAQAALETGWGRRQIQGSDGPAHNLFGIKATGRWSGDVASARTHEFVDGAMRAERAEFRAYASPAESFADYVRLLQTSPRYQQALAAGSDIQGFARGLQRAGYATDPAYAAKITAIAEGPTLDRALAALGRTGGRG
jgi:flagellar protein FlgJ